MAKLIILILSQKIGILQSVFFVNVFCTVVCLQTHLLSFAGLFFSARQPACWHYWIWPIFLPLLQRPFPLLPLPTFSWQEMHICQMGNVSPPPVGQILTHASWREK